MSDSLIVFFAAGQSLLFYREPHRCPLFVGVASRSLRPCEASDARESVATERGPLIKSDVSILSHPKCSKLFASLMENHSMVETGGGIGYSDPCSAKVPVPPTLSPTIATDSAGAQSGNGFRNGCFVLNRKE